MSEDRIQVEWFASNEDRQELEEAKADLEQDDPAASLELAEVPAPSVVGVAATVGTAALVMVGTVALIAITREVKKWVCQANTPGQVFYAARTPPALVRSEDVPGGKIQIMKGAEGIEFLDACKMDELEINAAFQAAIEAVAG